MSSSWASSTSLAPSLAQGDADRAQVCLEGLVGGSRNQLDDVGFDVEVLE
ncbi:hypothetical protein [Brevibacterium sp.]|nr:hypothetical protein [Brevibacterium sp.]MDN6604171.1 hypothetical protein [Brevibacterium sp.]